MRIVEKKMQNKDFMGARKIAIKDEQLYPDLEIISKMLTVCKIHYSTNTNWLGMILTGMVSFKLSKWQKALAKPLPNKMD